MQCDMQIECSEADVYFCVPLIKATTPDNVKFHDISLTVRSTPAHVKCYSYHVVLLSVIGVGMQQ